VIARPAAGVSGLVKIETRPTKSNLPEKICQACGRPFAWRKKWRANWEEVKTCSERCKGELRRQGRRS